MRVLMVCLGNICRSPMAQGVLEARAAAAGLQVTADSAGISGWHDGSPPDPRAVSAAARRGLEIAGQRARRVAAADYGRFDLFCAMDRRILDALRQRQPAGSGARLALLMDFAPGSEGRSVPDPYYDGNEAFDAVLDMIEAAVDGLLARGVA
jgi:protein-tyrosine phosphatase